MDVAENPRIDELKKRVEKDPTSIAFAQLAEEYRRIGEYQIAVNVCRDGLSRHPGYVSARVTLARALMELDQYPEAKGELQAVLSVAPDNLAAIRAMADVHQKLGDEDEAFEMPALSAPPPVTLPRPHAVAKTAEPAADVALPSVESPAADASDDVLGELSLDLPELPSINWDLDTALPPLPEFLADPPEPAEPPEPPGPSEPSGPSAPSKPFEGSESALGELEGWLDAILADRATR